MKSIIKYTIITAKRDWLFLGLFIIILLLSLLGIFLGNTAISEQYQTSISLSVNAIRITTVIGMILFICFHIRRLFENKEVEFILTKPITKIEFIASYFISFTLLSLVLIVPFMLFVISLHIVNLISIDIAGAAWFSLTLIIEVVVMSAVAFFTSLILSSALSSVLFCFVFYFMSRIFGFFLIAINNPFSLTKGSPIINIMEQVLKFIGILLPRFDLLSQSEWLIYGVKNLNYISVISTLLFVPILFVASVIDFKRKQF